MNATYSPEDNKLRLYSLGRLDPETYATVKSAGFRWAPKQDLFVAPAWSPEREDVLIELCGEIDDEDTSLVDRAEERAERFEEYGEKREIEAEQAHAKVEAITRYIPFGQPILVGHHSERRARKDAERIENGIRQAVRLWDTAKYWEQRAKGALRHAKYKERPDVRARRIKGLEADKRKFERNKANAERFLMAWQQQNITMQAALAIANYDHVSQCFPLAEYPRENNTYEGEMSLWTALDHGIITPTQAAEIAIPVHQRTIEWCNRWIAHLDNRLLYEKTMLSAQGRDDLLKPKPRPEQLPLCNYRAPEGIKIKQLYASGFKTLRQVEMTKTEYQKLYLDRRGTRTVDNSHRVRVAILTGWENVAVFLTDSKAHVKPTPQERNKTYGTQEIDLDPRRPPVAS